MQMKSESTEDGEEIATGNEQYPTIEVFLDNASSKRDAVLEKANQLGLKPWSNGKDFLLVDLKTSVIYAAAFPAYKPTNERF